VSQDWSLATDRNTEVVSDATNVLALEAAVRRGSLLEGAPRSREAVHLAASHRLVRPQFMDDPRFFAHFSLFGLCSAGRDGEGAFDVVTVPVHAAFHGRLLRAFLGDRVALSLRFTDFSGKDRRDLLDQAVLEPLRAALPGAEVRHEPGRETGRGYYEGLCFHWYGTLPTGEEVQLVDGGAVEWTAKLLGNARERTVISGVGSERVCTLDLRAPAASRGPDVSVTVEPLALHHAEGFREALDRVARERRHLCLLEAQPLEAVRATLAADLERGVPRFVALHGQTVVGWCDVSPSRAPGTGHVGSVGMGLVEGYRGRGLGSRLLRAAVDRALEAGLRRVELEVFASNHDALALYERFGFRHEGVRRRARFLDGRWDDMVLMALYAED
jgi:RimJ/RimL family protein N-acetyltransferase